MISISNYINIIKNGFSINTLYSHLSIMSYLIFKSEIWLEYCGREKTQPKNDGQSNSDHKKITPCHPNVVSIKNIIKTRSNPKILPKFRILSYPDPKIKPVINRISKVIAWFIPKIPTARLNSQTEDFSWLAEPQSNNPDQSRRLWCGPPQPQWRISTDCFTSQSWGV